MALFNFGKKKQESSSVAVANARFIVLGACCKRALETFENTKTALREMGFEDAVLNVSDPVEIAKFGVMQLPALVIDSKVMAYGKLLSVEDVKGLVEKSGATTK